MKLKFSNTFLGYYKFYYSVLGSKINIYLFLSVIVSFLDGIGLAMFMPLFEIAGSSGNAASKSNSMGKLQFLVDGIEALGFSMTIGVVLVILVILFAFKGAVKFFQLNYQVELKNTFLRNIRFALVDNLQKLTYVGFLKLDSGRIRNTFTNEVSRLFQTMNFYFNAAQSAVMLLTYVFIAVLANYQFAIMVVIGAGLSNLMYKKIYEATKSASMQVSKKSNAFNSLLTQAIHSFKYLKATNYFGTFSKNLKKVIKDTEALNRKMGLHAAITASVKEPMVMLIVAIVMYIQLNLMGASLTSILLSLMLFYRALTALVVVQNYWQGFIQNIGAMEAVSSLYNEMATHGEVVQPKQFATLNTDLLINQVNFSYEDNAVLNDLNISIPKNHTVAIVGESGSGKTTIANLIAGLIQPKTGELLVDNVSLGSYDVNSYRNRVGYISQESVIFNDDIFNNITFWDERTEENLNRFWEIVDLASLTDFINNQPDKEFTQLGDNGSFISGGQKQRISIARELYKHADILILDEATSALDSETERIIQENIEKLRGKYTMIIIAHRLATIKQCDTIYLLDKGNVSAQGTFAEILEKSDRFKKMISLQEI